jgi:cell division protein FtsX
MKVSNKKLIRRITFRSLKENFTRTMFTIAAIAISTAMISAVCGFAASGRQMLFEVFGKDVARAQSTVGTVYILAAVLGGIIVATSVVIASNAFRVSAGERIDHFGLLKTIGATKKQITASVLYEGVFLCMIGIPLGLLLGNGIHLIGAVIMESLLDDAKASEVIMYSIDEPHFKYIFSLQASALAVCVSFFTVLFSAWLPARKAAKISPIDAIRQTGEIQADERTIRISPLVKRLFGCEGVLAAKHAKRAGHSFRATVIALSISISIVMVTAFFINAMSETTYTKLSYAKVTAVAEYVSSYEYRLSEETIEKITLRLKEYPDVVIHVDSTDDGRTISTGWLVETDDIAGFCEYARMTAIAETEDVHFGGTPTTQSL